MWYGRLGSGVGTGRGRPRPTTQPKVFRIPSFLTAVHAFASHLQNHDDPCGISDARTHLAPVRGDPVDHQRLGTTTANASLSGGPTVRHVCRVMHILQMYVFLS